MSQASVIPFRRPPLLKQQPALKHFKRITGSIAVESLRAQLEANPQLWDGHPSRTDSLSPHYGVSDIHVRYRPVSELTEPKNYIEPHWAEWYPCIDRLPAIKPIVFGLMHLVRATHLGGVLITRINPGGVVKPHRDDGWHAISMDTKIHVVISGNPECRNFCEDESVVFRPGDAWTFSNLVTHSVENTGVTDRLNLIVCLRTL